MLHLLTIWGGLSWGVEILYSVVCMVRCGGLRGVWLKVWCVVLMGVLSGCTTQEVEEKFSGVMGLKRTPVEVIDGEFTPEVLWSLGRLTEFVVSPDGESVVYTVQWCDKKANRTFTEVYKINLEGNENQLILKRDCAVYNFYWGEKNRLYYISTESGMGQIYSMDSDGRHVRCLSDVEHGVEGFKYTADESMVAYVSRVPVVEGIIKRHSDLPLATGRVYDDLMYRHWNRWNDGTRCHLFVSFVEKNQQIKHGVDIMLGEPYDTPLQPFGGMEQIDWSPNGNHLAYTCKKLKGRDAALSTNAEIYVFNTRTRQINNLTAPNSGCDWEPVYSPDGRYLAWLSMERPGFEADRSRLMVMEISTGKKWELAPNFDASPEGLQWHNKSTGLYFVAGVKGTYQLYYHDLKNEEPIRITQGMHDYTAVRPAGNWLVASRNSMVEPAELYRVRVIDGLSAQLTHINTEVMEQLVMPTVQERWIRTTDNQQMLTWVVLPPKFDSMQLYPALLYCEGGPQSSLTQFWSYRWNLALMASQGYVVVAPNRRGVLTFGQKWTDQISKDHGGQEMRDLLCAIDEVSHAPWIDRAHLGAVGASYGGYTVNWLAGHHQGRFKAFISHCGVFHSEMQAYTTEELFFEQWEMGGAPWERDNRVAQASYRQSPHHFVEAWDTPILFIHGGHDYRISYVQALAGFTAARARGVESRLLYFPDEGHWVVKPQNGLMWQREFFHWLDTYLK